jgi:hypothetical protein
LSPEWGLWHLTPAYRGWGHTYPISPAPLKPLVTQPTLPPHQHRRPEAPDQIKTRVAGVLATSAAAIAIMGGAAAFLDSFNG